MKTSEVITKLKDNKDILYIYWLPRSLYGIEPDKDYYLFIVTEDFKRPEELLNADFNYSAININDWFLRVMNGDILAWECACLNKKYVIKEHVKLLMKTDLLQLRQCVDIQLDKIGETEFPSEKQQSLKAIKYCIFANQIIENHKIVNYNVLGNAHNALSRTNYDDIKKVFYDYFNPEYNLLKKRTDEILYKSKLAKVIQNE